MKKWIVKQKEESGIVETVVRETGLNRFFSTIISRRGIKNREDAEKFFNRREFSDPYDMRGMREAVDVIRAALENGEKITVYGDYDCDGVTATVMLYNYLCAAGGEVDWYIPERSEGYGMNSAAIKKIAANGTKLIVTVDNGISAIEEAELAHSLNVKLVITDHHQPSEKLPAACAVIDPHIPDDKSGLKELAGCGIALKLIMALEEDIESVLEQFADLAAIGTIGDIVPLVGENRSIVRYGMEFMCNTENPGLLKLLRRCGITPANISSVNIAFSIVPRINAAGRCGSPKTAAELFICENPVIAGARADEICLLNDRRKELQEKIISGALKIAEDREVQKRRVMIVSGKNWDHGVIGLAAAKLLERFGKPTVIITEEGDISRGSCRSMDGFDIFKMLEYIGGDILLKFGGHEKAGGFTLETARVPEFIAAAEKFALEKYPQMPPDTIYIDKTVTPGELTVENARLLEKLEPFGEANPVPVFLMRNVKIIGKKALKDGRFVAFNAIAGGQTFKFISFSYSFDRFWYAENDIVDVVFNVAVNEYNGKESLTLKLVDIRASGIDQERYFNAKAAYEALERRERIDPRLIRRIIPDLNCMKHAYDIFRKYTYWSQCESKALEEGINYCMLKVITSVFEEFNLIRLDILQDRVELLPAGGKADLKKSVLLAQLREQIEKGV